jgi:hypothetical protein
LRHTKVRDIQLENISAINPEGIGYIATLTIQFIAQTHVWDLLKNKKHNVLKELYEELQLEISVLGGNFVASGGRLETVGNPIVAYYDEAIIRIRMNELRNLVDSAIDNTSDIDSTIDSLVNIREILDKGMTGFNNK